MIPAHFAGFACSVPRSLRSLNRGPSPWGRNLLSQAKPGLALRGQHD
jgi:hypothetical protein